MADLAENPAEVTAAGAVVTRKISGGNEVLLVHRPRYDDWSFPKGKVDPGEHVTTAAVREVAEETGLDIRLGPPLATQHYVVGNGEPGTKSVHYWGGRVVGGDGVGEFAPNAEVDDVRWLSVDEADALLSYDDDRRTLTEMHSVSKKTYPLIILRHARARSRRTWTGNDRERTLSGDGELQAEQLVPVLGAFGAHRLVSSSSRRCWQTVAPYADVADVEIEVTDQLSQEDATPASVAKQVSRLLAAKAPSVLCTHRPVLPRVFKALGVTDPKLKPGAMLVAHHRRGAVVATEKHGIDPD